MSLLPEIEQELLRAARRLEAQSTPTAAPAGSRPRFLGIRRVAASALALAAVLGTIAVGAVFLLALHPHRDHGPALSQPRPAAAYPGAPQTQPGRWEGAGLACPLAPASRYLQPRSGCVSTLRADVTGDGQLNLVLLYGRLTRTRVGQLYVPSSFTLEVVRPDGAVIKTRIPSPQANPALLEVGNVNGEPGAELFVLVGRISSGLSASVYTFRDNQLVRPDVTLGYGGDSGLRAGFSCEVGRPPRLVQHSFILQGPGENGLWQRTNTIYAWHGANLRMIARNTSEHRGLPPLAATGIGVGCGTLDRATVVGSGSPSMPGSVSGQLALNQLINRFAVLRRPAIPAPGEAPTAPATRGDVAVSRYIPITGSFGVWFTAGTTQACLDWPLAANAAPQTGAGACNSNLSEVEAGGLFGEAADKPGSGGPMFVDVVPDGTRVVTITLANGRVESLAPHNNLVSVPEPSGHVPPFKALRIESDTGKVSTWCPTCKSNPYQRTATHRG